MDAQGKVQYKLHIKDMGTSKINSSLMFSS